MTVKATFKGYKKTNDWALDWQRGSVFINIPTIFGFNFAGLNTEEELFDRLREELIEEYQLTITEARFERV